MEQQVKLMRWWGLPSAQAFADSFAQDVADKGRNGASFYQLTPRMERAKLERAEPVYVDEPVLDLIEHAMESVKPEPLRREDFFTPEGFALLSRPVALQDVHGKEASFRAFSWGSVLVAPDTEQGQLTKLQAELERVNREADDADARIKAFDRTSVRAHSRQHSPLSEEYIREENLRSIELSHNWMALQQQSLKLTDDIDTLMKELASGASEQLHVTLYAHWDDDDDYTPRLRADFATRHNLSDDEARQAMRGVWGSDLSMYHAALLPYGIVPEHVETLSGIKLVGSAEGALEDSMVDMAGLTLWQFIQTFFRLAEQEVVTATRTYGDRHARKRLKRLREDKDGILVVTLRRKKQPRHEDADESNVEWSCQWPVSGHWRNQWYPSRGEHRQKWIGGYIKGPEHMPLRIHAGRAFEFRR